MRKLHRRTKRTTKSVLRLLVEVIVTPSMSSLISIVRSPAWRSTGQSLCGIAHISNLANSHQARSTCALGPCGALLTKQSTVVCSVLTLPLEFAGLRE